MNCLRKMACKGKVGDRSKIAEKVSMHMMLMGYSGDYQLRISQELNRRKWRRKRKLSRKWNRRLQYLLCNADSATLLSFTVTLGRLLWSDNLNAKRRKFEKKLSEKIKQWRVKKKKRTGKPGKLRTRRRVNMGKRWKERKGNAVGPNVVVGFQMRPVLGSRLRKVVQRKVTRHHIKVDNGSLMYRLAMSMKYLSVRNVNITCEWEFWVICFVKKFCGFWGSIAFDKGLSDSLMSIAKEFGLPVVSSEHLERLESCFRCSSSLRCLGCRAE
ncbi:hypothetical protein BVRB_7g161780 [Beta vulgaris subsp. vulgaris]|uniref:uncharacterized protein LOC104898664 n=1 Tax=Beta vulgaris subsp. vulgaris TaxID=3555 RepID=UPI00053FBF8D|nr:uncharacterized protein LOC104898664 [Beta vulgaris subsp. vulgaris]KMT06253.1 hypothetical protein BVRB_7g161780 [Beta vulgaris subsp. vulgaris]